MSPLITAQIQPKIAFRLGFLPAGAGRLSSVPCAAYPLFTADFGLAVIPPHIRFSKSALKCQILNFASAHFLEVIG